MIKYRYIIEEQQCRVRDAASLRMRVGAAIRPAGDAVAEEPHRAAAKWRKQMFVVHPERMQLLFQQAGRIGSVAIEFQRAARIESDKGVAAEVLTALDGLEEKCIIGVARKCRESGHGRQRIGAELTHDGDDVVVA